MKRLELIFNQAVEEDILEALADRNLTPYYTKIPGIMGLGSSGPRRGDHIWPEENTLYILYAEDKEAEAIRAAVASVKERFTDEGIKLFEVGGEVK